MKRKLIIAVGLVILILFLWWLFHRTQERQNIPFATDETNQTTLLAPPQTQQGRQMGGVPSVPEPTPESNPAAWIVKRTKQMEADRERVLDRWRTPIEFYGRVVDENTNPVASAEIDFDCNDTSLNGTSYYHAQSDANGLFSIKNIQGLLLGVKVHKEGYYPYLPFGDNFYYAGQNVNFVPDANNPIVFRLLKKGAGEALIHFHKSFRVPKDGTPIQIDLATGDQISSGQNALKVECWTRNAGKKSGEKYDWKCDISIAGGGLQLYDEEFPFLAPKANYVPGDEIDMAVRPDVRWQSDVERRYFIRTADGKFGRVIFGMVAGGDHFCVVDSFFNPSGSRNLEPQ